MLICRRFAGYFPMIQMPGFEASALMILSSVYNFKVSNASFSFARLQMQGL
jgi:hypothetical protein